MGGRHSHQRLQYHLQKLSNAGAVGSNVCIPAPKNVAVLVVSLARLDLSWLPAKRNLR